MRIGKFLDVSTGALDPKDLEILADRQEGPEEEDRSLLLRPRVIPHRFGWWVNVQHDDPEDFMEEIESINANELSDKFLNIFRYAAACKCDWINFDRDA